ncbi:TetR/AcrR family transcriptional regulator [Melissospora conviva]|uniref:TetR/AcrR family transcriptional regulator n=1 Tax=Melissospora conviva TaxID=3388432 RepID=UPI003C168ADB
MSDDRSGAGDPSRTLELLWRRDGDRAGRRGPRPALTLDGIVAAATELADAEGLGALTMRRVAQALGIAPMSLYTYVPGRAELLDLMLDAAYAAMPRSGHGDRPWRDRLSSVARQNWELYRRHPWAALVCTARPPLGPGMMAKYEHELRAFDGTGLSDVERDAALTYLLGFVQAAARAAAEVAAARTASAQTEAQWWAANGPLLAEVLDAQRYPTAARVGAAAGAAHDAAYDPAHAYEFGLARTLDGLGVLIEGGRPAGTTGG